MRFLGTVLAGLWARSPKAVPHRDRRCAMTFMPNSLLVAARPARWVTFARHTVSVLAVLTDALMIVGISVLVGASYHLGVYGSHGPLVSFLGVGVTTAGLFVLPGILRGEYELAHYLRFPTHFRRVFTY